jgi:hypothetical protein
VPRSTVFNGPANLRPRRRRCPRRSSTRPAPDRRPRLRGRSARPNAPIESCQGAQAGTDRAARSAETSGTAGRAQGERDRDRGSPASSREFLRPVVPVEVRVAKPTRRKRSIQVSLLNSARREEPLSLTRPGEEAHASVAQPLTQAGPSDAMQPGQGGVPISARLKLLLTATIPSSP